MLAQVAQHTQSRLQQTMNHSALSKLCNAILCTESQRCTSVMLQRGLQAKGRFSCWKVKAKWWLHY